MIIAISPLKRAFSCVWERFRRVCVGIKKPRTVKSGAETPESVGQYAGHLLTKGIP